MKSFYTLHKYKQQQGSAQQILVLFVMALLLVAMLMAVFGYKIGQKQGFRKGATSQVDQAPESSVSEAVLSQKLTAAIQERYISLSNLESLRKQNEELTTQNLQLSQFNDLLKSKIITDGGIPLEVLGVQIVALPDDTFEYRFDVAMVAKSGEVVMMTPKLTLLNATSMVEIPLKPASYEIRDIEHIRGRFIMPEGFSPKQIKLEINAGAERITELYNWRVGGVMAIKEDKGLNERPVGSDQK